MRCTVRFSASDQADPPEATSTDEGLDEGPRCSVCGSPNLRYVQGDYKTGVYAPDGGAERRTFYGYQCLECGAMEEC